MAGGESLSEEEVARRAEVGVAFVRRAVAAGALEETGPFSAEDAARLRFLGAWDDAGLAVEAVGDLIRRGEISFSFLTVPWLAVPPRLGETYEDLAERTGIGVDIWKATHEALGFTPPDGADRVRPDDLALAAILQAWTSPGVSESAVLRLLRVYSGSLRRMAQAEAELYESEVEARLREAGAGESDLLRQGGAVGTALAAAVEEALLSLYRRHRQHVWLDHSIGHVEILLEERGLYERLDRPPCVCFVDLTGYTRLTEEQGDAAAAEMAGRLASLVESTSRRFDGRPVRWLGDGGMFVFPGAGPAVEAAVEVTGRAVREGLPPTHTGIHSGPVVFQDGDIYGRTVNVAARLSAAAGAGEILVSAAAAGELSADVALEDLGGLDLKGLAEPMRTYRVVVPVAGDPPPGT